MRASRATRRRRTIALPQNRHPAPRAPRPVPMSARYAALAVQPRGSLPGISEGPDRHEWALPDQTGLLGKLTPSRLDGALALVHEPAGQRPAVAEGLRAPLHEQHLASLRRSAEYDGVTAEGGPRVVVGVLHVVECSRHSSRARAESSGRFLLRLPSFERSPAAIRAAASARLRSRRSSRAERPPTCRIAPKSCWPCSPSTSCGARHISPSRSASTPSYRRRSSPGCGWCRPGSSCSVSRRPAARELRISPRELRIVSIVGLLLLVGGQYGMMLAEQYVSSGLAALVVALVPLWIALGRVGLSRHASARASSGWLGLGDRLLRSRAFCSRPGSRASAPEGPSCSASRSSSAARGCGPPAPSTASETRSQSTVWSWPPTRCSSPVLPRSRSARCWASGDRFSLTPKGAGALALPDHLWQLRRFHRVRLRARNLARQQGDDVRVREPGDRRVRRMGGGQIGLVPAEPITRRRSSGMVVIVAGVALTTAAPTLPPRRRPSRPMPSCCTRPSRSIEPEPSEV